MSQSPECLKLIEVIRRLAAPAGVQEQYLRELGTYPSADELALELTDIIGQVPKLRAADEISGEAMHALGLLDQKVISFSGQKYADLWEVAALHSSPIWSEVRDLARLTLRALGA